LERAGLEVGVVSSGVVSSALSEETDVLGESVESGP
jgi:hypothetical protein